MSEKDKQGEPKWCAKCENFVLDDPKRMVGHCKINRLSIYAETLVPCVYFKGGIKMDNKVYVVIEEGYYCGYGSYPYLIGVFDTKEKAEEIAKTSFNGHPRKIIEIEKNKEFPLDGDEHEASNEYPLGGYAE